MKNKGLGITLIVLLAIIAIALISIMILAIVNKDKEFRISLFSIGDKTKLIYENKYDIREIEDIGINVASQNVKFVEGNENEIKVTIYGEENEKYNVNVENKKLKISRENKVFHIFMFMSWVKEEIVVELPKNYGGDTRNKSIKRKCNAYRFRKFKCKYRGKLWKCKMRKYKKRKYKNFVRKYFSRKWKRIKFKSNIRKYKSSQCRKRNI